MSDTVGRLLFNPRRSWLTALLIAVVVAALPWLGLSAYLTTEVALVLIYGMVISGLNVAFGYAGELALGQVFLFALGAYVAGVLDVHGMTDAFLGLAAAGVVAGIVGLVIGIPGLWLGKYTFAMVSFFLVTLIPSLVALFGGQTGGAAGLVGVLSPTIGGLSLFGSDLYLFIAIVVAAWFAFCRMFLVSPYGRALRVVRQSDELATSLGMSVYRMRVMAYVIAAVPAGVAGALFAYLYQVVDPASFALYGAIGVFAGSLLGGSMSIYGALIGAVIVEGGPIVSSGFSNYAAVAYGLMLIVGGLVMRGGVIGLLQGVPRIRRWIARYGPAADLPGAQTASLGSFAVEGESCVITDVHKSFGGAVALGGVSVTAAAGKITALVGANGSGKTTLLNIISGFYAPDSGEVRLGDHQLSARQGWRNARTGVARTFQTPAIPDGMTVADVVGAAQFSARRAGLARTVLRSPRYRRGIQIQTAQVLGALSALGLADLASKEAESLSLGTRRLVEVARALVSRPRVILLDEPVSGLDPAEVTALQRALLQLREWGATIVLVEHNLAFVDEVADRTYVFSDGVVIAERPAPSASLADRPTTQPEGA